MTSTIWQQCLAQLEVELGQQQFETYIRPLQANFDAGQLTLKAPNVYVEKHVRQSYLERISEFLDSVEDIAPVELSVGEFVNASTDGGEKEQPSTDQREPKSAKKNTNIENRTIDKGEPSGSVWAHTQHTDARPPPERKKTSKKDEANRRTPTPDSLRDGGRRAG